MSTSWFDPNRQADAVSVRIGGRRFRLGLQWHVRGETPPASEVQQGEKVTAGSLRGKLVEGRFRIDHAADEAAITMRARLLRPQTLGINALGFSLRLPADTAVWAFGRRFDRTNAPVGTRLERYYTYGCLKVVMFEFGGKALRFACKWQVDPAHTGGVIVRDEQGWQLQWHWEPQAPFRPAVANMPPVTFRLFENSVAAAADYHRWIASAYRLLPRQQRPAIPGWFHEIPCMIGLWCKTNDGAVVHDFTDIQRLLGDLNKLAVRKNTLLYLMGWDGAYGVNHGYFRPDDDLGGARELRRLTALAGRLGYRVMLHSSIYLVDKTTPLYRQFLKAAIRDAYYREAHWPASQELCHQFPVPLGMINPSDMAFCRDRLGRLLKVLSLGADGLMFDSIDGQPNDPLNGDTYPGLKRIFRALRRRYPQAALTCETPTERVCPSMAGFAPGSRLGSFQSGEFSAAGGGVYDFAPLRAMVSPSHYLFAHDGGFPLAVPRPGNVYDDRPENFDRMIQLQRRRDDFPAVQLNYRQYGIDRKAKEILIQSTNPSNRQWR